MPFGLSAIGRTLRQVFPLSVVERWGGTGPGDTLDSVWTLDHTQTMSVAYSIPWIQNHRGWLGLEGIFYEKTPEYCSASG